MFRPLPLVLLSIAVALCLALAYALRFGLMEGEQWLGLCIAAPQQPACMLRAGLGWLIHTQLLAWAGLAVALAACVLPGRWGRRLALPALFVALPSLALYGASLAAFAVVLALLRLVRAPHPQPRPQTAAEGAGQ